MNYFMVAVGVMQYAAGLYGFWCEDYRVATMNMLVATANIVLAGAHA